MCMYIHMIYVYLYIHICLYRSYFLWNGTLSNWVVCLYIHICIDSYVYVYVHISRCIYIYTEWYISIYTHMYPWLIDSLGVHATLKNKWEKSSLDTHTHIYYKYTKYWCMYIFDVCVNVHGCVCIYILNDMDALGRQSTVLACQI